jgi:histidine ammonia-lyase
MNRVLLNGNNLTIEDVVNVARHGYSVGLTDDAVKRVERARKTVDDFVAKETVIYGITTGFGKFENVHISQEDTKDLQKNLIVSHACGVGNPFDEEVVRAVMLLRANALAIGNSGIRLSTLKTLIEMINKGVYPVIPEKGSLGASGDLAPLSHMVLVLIGMGEAFVDGKRVSGKEAMDLVGLTPVELTSKEGLALINGTQVMTAVGCLTAYDAWQLVKLADVSAALSVEALSGITDAYDLRIHKVRPHKGQLATASNLLQVLENSGLTTRQGQLRNQDAYALRCVPQIHGASKDAISYVLDKVNIEINSVTDNPIILPEDNLAFSGGNFHGQPMALPFDFLGIAIAEIANSSERRIERLVNPQLNDLPAFLTPKGGLHSGFMIAQYAAAALVSENKVLAHPASVDSIPSSANQEDHVSMGTIAARKAREILKNAQNVISIELLAGAQGVDFRDPSKLGKGTKVAYDQVRSVVSKWVDDREMYKDMDLVYNLVQGHDIIKAVESTVGELSTQK